MKLTKAERIGLMRELSYVAAIKGGNAIAFTDATPWEREAILLRFEPWGWSYPNGSNFDGIRLMPQTRWSESAKARIRVVGSANWSSRSCESELTFAIREKEEWRLVRVDLTPIVKLRNCTSPSYYYAEGTYNHEDIRLEDVQPFY